MLQDAAGIEDYQLLEHLGNRLLDLAMSLAGHENEECSCCADEDSFEEQVEEEEEESGELHPFFSGTETNPCVLSAPLEKMAVFGEVINSLDHPVSIAEFVVHFILDALHKRRVEYKTASPFAFREKSFLRGEISRLEATLKMAEQFLTPEEEENEKDKKEEDAQ